MPLNCEPNLLGAFRFDGEAGVVEFDAAVAQVLGFGPQVGRASTREWFVALDPEDRGQIKATFIAVAAVRGPSARRIECELAVGPERSARVEILIQATGEAGRLVGTIAAVRPRGAIEPHRETPDQPSGERSPAPPAGETELTRILEGARLLVLQVDRAQRVQFANTRAARWLSAEPAALVGRRLVDVLPEVGRTTLLGTIAAALRGEETLFEFEIPAGSGEISDLSGTIVPQQGASSADVGGAWIVMRDITDQRRVESALRESEERFRTMADGLPLIVWVHDADGQQQLVNRTFCEFFEVTEAEMKGGRWKTLMHPDDAEAYGAEFARCVAERQPFHAETRVRRGDGEWRWIESFARPRFSETGEFLGFVGTSVDISEKKHAEAALRAARDEALAATSAKDRFMAILSHELRGPLNPAMLIASENQRDPSLPPFVREDFRTIVDNLSVQARLIEDLLDFNQILRGSLSLKLEPVDLDEVVKAAIATVQEECAAKGLQVLRTTSAPARSSMVRGDPVRLRQVFWNLLRNAVKFTPQRGVVEIASVVEETDQIVVGIKDNGIGMTADELRRAFQPFAQGDHASDTRARAYGGLGLGLTIAQMLVEAHGGRVEAESEGRGRGCVFKVRLPLLISVGIT